MAKDSKIQTSRIFSAPPGRTEYDQITMLNKRIRELEYQNKELNAEKPITIYFNKSIDRLAVLNKIGMTLATLP